MKQLKQKNRVFSEIQYLKVEPAFRMISTLAWGEFWSRQLTVSFTSPLNTSSNICESDIHFTINDFNLTKQGTILCVGYFFWICIIRENGYIQTNTLKDKIVYGLKDTKVTYLMYQGKGTEIDIHYHDISKQLQPINQERFFKHVIIISVINICFF
jgi:hypothetical protein